MQPRDRDPTSPTQQIVKRLFARSGNRCAFPKCISPIVQGNTVIGEICHIKAANQKGPRYDAQQSAIERHGYDNLILLCANHHTVVDDDPTAYTVERLVKMKSEHENRITPLDDGETIHAVQVFFKDSIATSNQSGGIAAHTINAETINIGNAEFDRNSIEATKKLWHALVDLRKEFSDAIFLDSILLAAEIDQNFKTDNWHSNFQTIRSYAHRNTAVEKMKRSGSLDIEKERLFVSERLWAIFFGLRSMYGRIAVLYQFSFVDQRFRNWRDDNLFQTTVRHILPDSVWAHARSMDVQGLTALFNSAEKEFLREAANKLSA